MATKKTTTRKQAPHPLDVDDAPRMAPRSKVWLHCYDGPGNLVNNDVRPFDRVPVVGDHFILHPGSSTYRVALVLLFAYADSREGMSEADVAGEVWAYRVKEDEMYRNAKEGAATGFSQDD